MARFTSINHSCISSKLKLFRFNNSQYSIIISYNIIDLFISYSNPEHFCRNRAYYACLWRAISQMLNNDFFLLFDIIIHKMKQQITENEENLFFGKKIAQVSVVTLKVRKKAKIRNQDNQVPRLTQDTVWKSDKKHKKTPQIKEPRDQPFPNR